MKSLNTTFLILLISADLLLAQDSLHYVRSFYGTSRIDGILYYAEPAGDINGDGRDDFTIYYGTGAMDYSGNSFPPCHTELYYGSDDIHNLKPSYVFRNARVFPKIGDINHDGFDDLLVAKYDSTLPTSLNTPEFRIYYGGKQLDTISSFSYRPEYVWHSAYYSAGMLGDINGDGYDDFAFMRPTSPVNGAFGMVYVFLGGKTPDSKPAMIISPPLSDTREWKSFATQATGIGDINHDGYDDFVVNGGNTDSGRVFLYYGGSKLNDQPVRTLTNPFIASDYSFGVQIRNAGDLNKDGQSEMIINAGMFIYIYFGLDSVSTIRMIKYGGSGAIGIASGGDINGDGYNDLLLGNTSHLNSKGVMVGQAILFYGKPVIDTTENYAMEGTDKWFDYSMFMSIPGDINGDGCDEVFIQEPNWPDYNRTLGKVNLYSYKKITGLDDHGKEIKPHEYELLQNFPNPFNPSTTIKYELPEASNVQIRIYDFIGHEVARLVDKRQAAGRYDIKFNASGFASGLYVCRMNAVSLENGRCFGNSIKIMFMK